MSRYTARRDTPGRFLPLTHYFRLSEVSKRERISGPKLPGERESGGACNGEPLVERGESIPLTFSHRSHPEKIPREREPPSRAPGPGTKKPAGSAGGLRGGERGRYRGRRFRRAASIRRAKGRFTSLSHLRARARSAARSNPVTRSQSTTGSVPRGATRKNSSWFIVGWPAIRRALV